MSVGKDVYYQNVVLFVQRIQNLVTFKKAALVRTNIPTSLWGSALEWYTSELDDQERENLNKDAGIDNWISTLSQRFKVPTSVALGFLTSESYSLDDARRRRPPAQYVRAIIRHGIGCNIVDIANQLSFAYRGVAPELRIFIPPLTRTTKASDFIRLMEEKQEAWFDMLASRPMFRRFPSPQPSGQLGSFYYTPQPRLGSPLHQRQFPERSPLPPQSDAFARYQGQRSFDPNERYASPSSTRVPYRRQNFNPQRQTPFNRSAPQDVQQSTSISGASRDYNRADQSGRMTDQSGVIKRDPPTNRIHPQDFGTGHSSAPRQPYQSYPSQRAYQAVAKDFEYKGAADLPLGDIPDVGYTEEEVYDKDIFYTIEV